MANVPENFAELSGVTGSTDYYGKLIPAEYKATNEYKARFILENATIIGQRVGHYTDGSMAMASRRGFRLFDRALGCNSRSVFVDVAPPDKVRTTPSTKGEFIGSLSSKQEKMMVERLCRRTCKPLTTFQKKMLTQLLRDKDIEAQSRRKGMALLATVSCVGAEYAYLGFAKLFWISLLFRLLAFAYIVAIIGVYISGEMSLDSIMLESLSFQIPLLIAFALSFGWSLISFLRIAFSKAIQTKKKVIFWN